MYVGFPSLAAFPLRCTLEERDELAALCQRRTVSLDAHRGGHIKGQHAGYALKHGLVFHADATVEGNDLVGRHREVIVAPDDEGKIRGHIVDGRGEQ